MYYKHKAASMYDSSCILLAITVAEVPFILLASMVFCLLFYFVMGLALNAAKFFFFFLFVTLGMATFTFTGQMLVSLLRDAQTAQGTGALFITFSSLFSGILILPDEIPNFWIFMYWLLPGHWIFEGLFMTQFENDQTPILATPGSNYYNYLGCTSSPCTGTAWEWIQSQFVDFSPNNVKFDITYLIAATVVTRTVTYFALKYLDYTPN
jgi:ABC-type multidrug transport system permease subunit